MQLRLSVLASLLLATNALLAEDYVSVQFMGYDEDSGRTTIITPSVEINKEFGADYTLNLSFTHDSVSGASPTYYDAFSGASAKLPDSTTLKHDVKYGNIEYEDERKAVSLALTKRFESRDELTLGGNFSDEYDYTSKELSAEFLHYINSTKNQSVSFGVSYQKNDVSINCDLGNSECDALSGASEKIMDLDVLSSEVGFTQIIDKTSLIKASLFYINEDGYLSNPYMRVVRDYNTNAKISQEVKPDDRTAYGATLAYSKSINSKLSSITNYRFYSDDWDITSHTIENELYYEWSDDFVAGLGIRYYIQSEADFYSHKKDFFTDQKYASSDRRISDFDSVNIKLSAEYKLNKKISLNSSINYYEQFDYFDAKYYNIGVKYKF